MSERPITIRHVAVIVAEDYGASLAQMRGPARKSVDVKPRQVAMYLAHRLIGQSLPALGRYFNRDHTTVLHAIRAVTEDAERDPVLAGRLHDLAERINAAEMRVMAGLREGADIIADRRDDPEQSPSPPVTVVMAPIQASDDPRVRRVIDAVRGYVESRRALSDATHTRGEAGARRRVETEYALLDRAWSAYAAGRDRS
ncbi:helix-turn-helix domain-containing protein [Methylobacterium aquaticum]|uniref:helix-turn-helix domain-containing protein n=1 Tax=Methylobacterium aquaticum TaxID=270351 RepID=UPI003D16E79C